MELRCQAQDQRGRSGERDVPRGVGGGWMSRGERRQQQLDQRGEEGVERDGGEEEGGEFSGAPELLDGAELVEGEEGEEEGWGVGCC